MPLEIVTIPCLADNYAFLAHDRESGATAVVDVPDAAPILAELNVRGWTLTDIFLTHHHADHVGGVPDLLERTGAKVSGAAADAHRLPPLDTSWQDGDAVAFGGETGRVYDVSGHTLGHIAIHFPESAVVFTADSLMAMGCGRLFEGNAATMWASLAKLAALPPETVVCSGHEYTLANARFAVTIDPDNPALQTRTAQIEAARAAGVATVPSTLAEELETNPFLRATSPEVKAHLGMAGSSDEAVFAEIRKRKDAF